ncbi:SDR family oxidoreductase [Gordonia shandongensis]|uniref:SDR family oxidoreductase n=1 Tax=Gordonia shandongensis TaxID=376351 RepID=UPI0004267574|nr:SDR family oxidoreductase [Gordonia shandongensis]
MVRTLSGFAESSRPTGTEADTAHSVVTGAGSGIGAATALRLASRGPVSLLDRDPDGLAATERAVASAGGRPTTHLVDVTDEVGVRAALAEAEDATGPIDRLAHCAGTLVTGPVVEATAADWATALTVNLTGAFVVMTTAVRRMVERRAGSIVVVGSNAGNGPRTGLGVYGASKAAVHNLALTLALETAVAGVRINVVAPGSTDTPMQEAFGGLDAAESAIVGDLGRHRLGIPLGRMAAPDDVAATIEFLLSSAARHITAQVLTVDGGATV